MSLPEEAPFPWKSAARHMAQPMESPLTQPMESPLAQPMEQPEFPWVERFDRLSEPSRLPWLFPGPV